MTIVSKLPVLALNFDISGGELAEEPRHQLRSHHLLLEMVSGPMTTLKLLGNPLL